MQTRFWVIILAASSLAIGTEVRSDESIRILEDSHNNLRYSQYEVIEDHPACNASDEIALYVPLRIDELDYAIADPTNNIVIFESDQVYRECTLTTRRGTERVVSRIPCSEDIELDSDDRLKNLALSVEFEGGALLCASPRNIRLIETSWALNSVSEIEIDGHPASISTSSEAMQQISGLDDRNTTSVEIDFSKFFGPNYWTRSSRGHELVQSLVNRGTINVTADCIPLVSNLPEPLFVQFIARFVLVNDPEQTCTAVDCPVPLLNDTTIGYKYSHGNGEVVPLLSGTGTGQHCLSQ